MSATVISLDAYRDDTRLSVIAECMEIEGRALRAAALLIEMKPTVGTVKAAIECVEALDALVALARTKLRRLS